MSFLTRAATIFFATALTACTATNPYYVEDVPSDSDGGTHSDLGKSDASIGDLAGADLTTPPDLAGAPACASTTTRSCGPMGSLSCESGMVAPDRTCPNASMCVSGYCAPPQQAMFGATVGRNCSWNNKPNPGACNNFANDASCQPFLDPMNPSGPVRWTCDTKVGAGGNGVACTSGASCSSGFCASNGTCFMPCDSDASCYSGGGNNWRCQSVSVVVEGRMLSTKSCFEKP